jgi:hypothetical protein
VTDASVYNAARSVVAGMLGYADLDNLSPEQSTRLDICTALRIAVDAQSGMLARNETTDVTKLLAASEALAKLLPPLREPPPEANEPDPREIMWQTYLAGRRRGAQFGEGIDGAKLTIERLKAELAAKDARIAELETALAGSVPLPPNAVKLSTRVDNPRPSPPSPSANRTHESNLPPAAPVFGDLVGVVSDPGPSPADYVEPDGSIRSTPRGTGKYWGPIG